MRLDRASIVALVFLAVACSKSKEGRQDAVVARVGSHTVTKAYYEDRLEKMERSLLPDTLDLAGKRKFLEFIINKEVLALKAEELGYAEDPEVKVQFAVLEEQILSGKSVERAIKDKVVVTDAEIQKFYDQSKRKVLAKQILMPTKKEAEELLPLLRAGANFDSMVDVHSHVPRIGEDGLEIPVAQRAIFGELEYGRANPKVEAAIFDTPLGQVAEPVETPYGWHVFMPFSESPMKLRALEEERPRLEEQITRRKRREATNDYYESILAKHKFVMHSEAFALVNRKMPLDSEEPVDPANEVKPVIDFNFQERETPLFEVDGKKYTVGDFSDRYDQTSYPERPKKWVGAQGLYYWVRDVWLKPLQLEQARTDGIDQLPEVVNEMKLRHEMLMVGQLHDKLIGEQVPTPSEEEVRKFYEDHAKVYVEKEKRVCNLIFHPREAVVRRAYEEIRGGAEFVATAIRYNDFATKAEDVKTAAFSRDDQKHAELADSAFSRGLNEYSQPFKTTQGWIVLQVQQIIPERPFTLEDVRENVVQDWQSQWSEKRLNELLEEWKKNYPIEVDERILLATEVRRDDVVVPGKIQAGTQ